MAVLSAFILSALVWGAPSFEPIQEDAQASEVDALPDEASFPKAGGETKESEGPGVAVQATVRLIRSSPQTEVFFTDRKESLIIPQGSQHNAIFEACLQSSKTRTPVSLRIDPKARIILSGPSAKASPGSSRSQPNSQGESSKGSN